MIFPRTLLLTALALCTLLSIASHAQEPAYLYGMQAARYVEGPDFFHYVFPCKPAASSAVPDSIPVAEPAHKDDRAMCWPVRAIRLQMAGEQLQQSQAMDGILAVSASQVTFIPNDSKAFGRFTVKVSGDSPVYRYVPGAKAASLFAGNVGYSLVLKNVCSACASGTTAPALTPGANAQLDREYAEIGDSLKRFDAVADRIAATSAIVRTAVTPHDQPAPNDRPAMMAIFAQFNKKVARVCPESARACVDSYAKYQECKASPTTVDCGPLPACTAVCPLTRNQIQNDLYASICTSRFSDSAALFPDWTPLFAEDDARRKANLARLNAPAANPPKQIQMIKEEAPPPVPPVTGPPLNPRPSPQNICTATSAYNQAELMHMSAPAVAGVAGMAGMMGGPPSGPGAPFSPTLHPGAIRIQDALAAGYILQRVTPTYPPIARAAHVSGSVILHALISSAGDVENLTVISGPPMLQSAALDAVKQWKYRPYLLNGQPTAVDTTITVNFNFNEAPSAPPAPQPTPPPLN